MQLNFQQLKEEENDTAWCRVIPSQNWFFFFPPRRLQSDAYMPTTAIQYWNEWALQLQKQPFVEKLSVATTRRFCWKTHVKYFERANWLINIRLTRCYAKSGAARYWKTVFFQCTHDYFFILRRRNSFSTESGHSGRWQNGRMAEWQNGKRTFNAYKISCAVDVTSDRHSVPEIDKGIRL